MRRALLASAVLCGLSYTALARDPLVPCERVTPEDISHMVADGFVILDITPVAKMAGNNLCAVLIDTNKGRVMFTFTTVFSVGGESSLIKSVSITPMMF